jgi:hypothetical protein
VLHHRILVLLLLLMRSIERSTRSCFVRTIILAGVITCLCFSVGEGLRLTPFPLSALAVSEATNIQFKATVPYESSRRNYGPIDVPTWVQNRGKRQVVDYGNPPSQNSRELTAHPVILPVKGEAVDIVSLLLGSRAPSRAPPFIS